MSAELERVRASLARRGAVLEELERAARGACCPGCFHGREYAAALERAERTRGWLVVLLLRRGREEDLREAAGLVPEGVPEHVLVFLRRRAALRAAAP